MIKYQCYDKEKDFSKDYCEKVSRFQIFPLSKLELSKYLNQATFLHEKYNDSNNSDDIAKEEIKNENNNNIKLRNSKSSVDIVNKFNITTNQYKENIKKELDDKKKLIYNHSYNNLNEKKCKLEPKLKSKIKYFEPKIIQSKLINKYLNKGHVKLKRRNNSCFKLKIDQLPLITYNKLLGHRKIEIKKINAYNVSSSLSNSSFNHKSYFMGEKYNPKNYEQNCIINRTSRNELGILYNH